MIFVEITRIIMFNAAKITNNAHSIKNGHFQRKKFIVKSNMFGIWNWNRVLFASLRPFPKIVIKTHNC